MKRYFYYPSIIALVICFIIAFKTERNTSGLKLPDGNLPEPQEAQSSGMKIPVFSLNIPGSSFMTTSSGTRTLPKSGNDGQTIPEGIDKNWYSSVIEQIRKQEYEISRQEDRFRSPNRAQHLEFTYLNDGFIVKPMESQMPSGLNSFDNLLPGPHKSAQNKSMANTDKPDKEMAANWEIRMSITGYGKDGAMEDFTGKDMKTSRNTACIEDKNFRTEYINDERGMRQNFIVKYKPTGDGLLKVNMNFLTKLQIKVSPKEISFSDKGQEKMKYNDLKVYDSEGRKLSACFEEADGNDITIAVDDNNAVYPVTIDPLSSASAWTANGNQANANFGNSVSAAGDVNGDGYNDVVIGAYGFDNGQTDEGRAYLYLGSSSGLNATPAWTAESNQANANFGNSVSAAGDVNGDGYSDVVIGAYLYDNGQTDEGRAYVYLGSSSGLNTTPAWEAESNQASAFYGSSVSTAGDVNGDGFSDVIIGAYEYDNGQMNEGRAFIYLGSSSGLNTTPAWTAESNQASAFFGNSVSAAGDVNGDGFSDVIIGAYEYDNGQTDEGRAYVYLGSSSGLNTTPAWTAENNIESAKFSNSVSVAGDVNGDGYSDVIIGAYWYTNGQYEEGCAYLYLGSASGLNTAPAWTAESDQAYANFACSVSTAGDVNGDGYSDVIIGAYDYCNGQESEGRAFLYLGSASGLNTAAAWTAENDQIAAWFGYSVSTAGDVNGDGYSDVIIGAYDYNSSLENEGCAYLFLGSVSGLNTAPVWSAEGNQNFSAAGFSVSSAGDINGDGYGDVIIAAICYNNGETYEGRAFLYLGSASGLNSNPAWTAEGNQANAYFGYSVSTAGDVNGDGYGDVIVGAYRYDNGEDDEGRAYLYFGSASGLNSNPAWTAEGDFEGAQFGNSVSTAGDVNGDGFSDVIIGAYSYRNGLSPGWPPEGRAYLYLGSASGLNTTPAWTAVNSQPYAWFGYSVSSAGDVNGDGYSDVIVGASYYDNGQTDEGRAYLYLGSASGLNTTPAWTAESNQAEACFGSRVSSAGDVNGDGYSDVIVGASYYDNGEADEGRAYLYLGSASGLNTTPAWTAESNQAGAGGYFGYSVSTAGDVNGDGFSDVIIGANEYDNGHTDEGRAYLYLGSASGLNAAPAWTAESNQAYASFGGSVSSAGDVNGDGFSDVIVGASNYDNGQTDEGRAFVYYGNGAGGLRSNVQQYQPSSTTVIGPSGKTNADGSVRLSIFAKSPMGRAKVRMAYEIKENGQPFSNNPSSWSRQSSYTDQGTSLTGISLYQNVTGIPTYKNYRWRARVMYSPVSNPYQVYGPWKYYTSYQPFSFGSFKSQTVPLPVELEFFSARASQNEVVLEWRTATEVNNYGFEIERKKVQSLKSRVPSAAKQGEWEKIGFVSAHGTSNSVHEYTFCDQISLSGEIHYRLKQVDNDGTYEYYDAVSVNIDNPREFRLMQNTPNPFNPLTAIKFQIPVNAKVSVIVYDMLGREVASLINEEHPAGSHIVYWNGRDMNGQMVSSGVYLYKLTAGAYTETRKMNLLK